MEFAGELEELKAYQRGAYLDFDQYMKIHREEHKDDFNLFAVSFVTTKHLILACHTIFVIITAIFNVVIC